MESVGVIFSSLDYCSKLLTVLIFLILLLRPKFRVFSVMWHHSPKHPLFWQKQTTCIFLNVPALSDLCALAPAFISCWKHCLTFKSSLFQSAFSSVMSSSRTFSVSLTAFGRISFKLWKQSVHVSSSTIVIPFLSLCLNLHLIHTWPHFIIETIYGKNRFNKIVVKYK